MREYRIPEQKSLGIPYFSNPSNIIYINIITLLKISQLAVLIVVGFLIKIALVPFFILLHQNVQQPFLSITQFHITFQVEVKPYVLDDQLCDECHGARCAGKFAPFFCANVTCLQYYCEQCWALIHSRQGREFHKPLVKEGADRPRTVPFRW